MKIVIALAGALVLAACASANKPASNAPGASVQSGTYYCWRDKLSTEGDSLVCNWESQRSAACDSSYPVTIKRGQVAVGPTDAGRCNNGQWLVMVTTR
jgi:hypothetical protein